MRGWQPFSLAPITALWSAADDHDRGGTAASGIILGWMAVRIDDDLAEFEQIWRERRYRSPFSASEEHQVSGAPQG
jgi:hypothetical protein